MQARSPEQKIKAKFDLARVPGSALCSRRVISIETRSMQQVNPKVDVERGNWEGGREEEREKRPVRLKRHSPAMLPLETEYEY